MAQQDYPQGKRPDPKEAGGPLDMPGRNNGRPGEDKDAPYGVLEQEQAKDGGKSPLEDAGAPGGTAGTTDVARVQEDHESN